MSSAIVIISAVRVTFFEINIKYRPGIKIYLSLHPLLKILLWNIVIFDIIKDI